MVTRVDKFLGGLGIDATDKFEVQSNATVTVGNGTSTGNVHVGGRVSIGNASASSTPLYIRGDSVGTSAGDQSIITTLRADATNQNFVEVSATREAAGSAWNDAGVRLQQKVDASYMGYIQFNGDNNDQGISFGAGVSASPTGVTERMRIVNNGRVGIGTETPSSELEVNGTITATAFSGLGTITSVVTNNTTSGTGDFTSAGITASITDGVLTITLINILTPPPPPPP